MGAGAAKHFQSEKAKHAATVLSTVQTYQKQQSSKLASPNSEVAPEFFKKTIQLAAAEAKRRGNNIDESLAQLSDADMETLRHYAESNNDFDEYEETDNFDAKGNRDLKLMLLDEDADDVVDETTSVLSYGEDEVVDESEIEPDSSNISPSHKRNILNGSPIADTSEDIDIVEENIENINEVIKDLGKNRYEISTICRNKKN